MADKDYLKVSVFDKQGKQVEEIQLPEEVFGEHVNRRLLDEVVRAYGCNQRAGTHDTKERAEVRGGGKKPWKQKGTGRARTGSIRNPLWRGGGTVFGPTPRDYSIHIPKKMRKSALVSALSLKAKEGNLIVLDDLSVSEPKTKEVNQILEAVNLSGKRVVGVVSESSENMRRASSNLRYRFSVKQATDVTAYHVMRRGKLLVDKASIEVLKKRVLGLSEDQANKKQEVGV